MTDMATDRERILAHLERVLTSTGFQRAERSSALLRYIVERAVDDRAGGLKEYTLGVEALGRGTSFDPRTDPIVRAEVSRLRGRLERYYETEGQADDVVIRLPRGSYVPQFIVPGAPAEAVAPEPAARAGNGRAGPRLGATAVLLGLLALAALPVVWWARSDAPAPGEAPLLRFEVELEADGTLGSEPGPAFALSPDGTRLVFAARDGEGMAHLYTRRLDQAESTLIPGTEGARSPFLSPDGRWVGFWADGSIKLAPTEGGAAVVLGAATDLLGASWGPAGQIVVAINPTGKLWVMPEAGGAPRVVLDLSAESARPIWPQFLPGGQAVLYTVMTGEGADRARVEVLSLRSGERKLLVRGGTYGRYLPNGYLTYVNQGTLYALPFDAGRLAVGQAPVPLLDDVAYSRTFGHAQMDVASSGTLVYRSRPAPGQFVVQWLDRDGSMAPLLTRPGRYNWLSLSPDGQRLALSVAEAGVPAIRIHQLGSGSTERIRVAHESSGLTWWPAADLLLIGGFSGLAWAASGGAESPNALTRATVLQVPWSISPDGSRLAYHEMSPSTGFDLWTVPVSATPAGLELGTAEPFLRTPAFEVYPSFSPDGRWLAYASNESGAFEVYVRRFPDDGTRVPVSQGGGRVARWSPNGREILYQTDEQRLMVASYRVEGGTLVVDSARSWLSRPLGDTGVLPGFDVAPDGERVAALMPAVVSGERQAQNHVTFMINFLDEVQRRVGRGGR